MQKIQKKILICPLDWGLGHATRCIPIINTLLTYENLKVIIAADNRPLELLKNEFPQLQFIKFPGYNISYNKKGLLAIKMFLSIPKILLGIYKEHKMLSRIIKDYNNDMVISDNRYGLWNRKIYSVFITHQIMVKVPIFLKFFGPILYGLNRFFIKKYDECWIPDFAGENNLSGTLSHPPAPRRVTSNAYYIGPLSRFKGLNPAVCESKKVYDLAVILSGPEPQRTILQEIILKQLKETTLKSVVVLGKTEEIQYITSPQENIKIYPHLNQKDLLDVILSSEIILSRPGYSTIMDLIYLKKKAIFVPTPGQTEQEYLAKYYRNRNIFYCVSQKEFNLIEAYKKAKEYQPLLIKSNFSEDKLKERIEKILKEKI